MQGFRADQWSGGKQVFWTHGTKGGFIEIEFPVPEDGEYALTLRMTKARDYGIFQLYVDGEKLGQPVDLYSTKVERTGPVTFDAGVLAKGAHTLRAEAIGSSSNLSPPPPVGIHLFGLDYLLLEKRRAPRPPDAPAAPEEGR